MIEIDLLPKGRQRPPDEVRAGSLRMAYLRSAAADPWVAAAGLASLLSVAAAAALFAAESVRAGRVQDDLRAAAGDSARYAAIIESAGALAARRDSIAGRAAVIREIDARRYAWPRTLDEVAAALPAEAWLTHVEQIEPARFRVEGKASSNFALTRFWNALEASRSVAGVRLVSTEHLLEPRAAGEPASDVYYFVLEADQVHPPPAELDMVVLFGGAPGGRGR